MAIKNINQDNLKEFEIVVPPMNLQLEFNEKINSLNEKINSLNEKINSLDEEHTWIDELG